MFTQEQFEEMVRNQGAFGKQGSHFSSLPSKTMDLQEFKDNISVLIEECGKKGLEVWISEEKEVDRGYHFYLNTGAGRQYLVYYNFVEKCGEYYEL